MSRTARTVVRLAARALPLGVRARYREEWLGDLEGRAEARVRASGIAAAAVLFTATLRRDTPDLLGMPLAVAARRHARWATALLLSAMVFAFGSYFFAGFSRGNGPLLAAQGLWIALTVAGTVGGLVTLWRAAALSSPLARIGAAILTAALVVATWGLVIPATNTLVTFAVPIALLLGIVGTCIAAAAWAGSAGAPAPAAPVGSTTSRRLPAALVVAIIVAATLFVALALLLSGLIFWLAVFVIPIAALVAGTIVVVRARRTAREPAPRHAWLTVLLAGGLGFVTVVVGGFDLLVWSPQAQAPGYTLAQIWAALPPGELAFGMAFAIVWIVFWTVATLVYLGGSIAMLGRAARPCVRSLASAGLLLVAGAVFFQFFAGFGIGMSIADTLPPFSGGGSSVRAWYAMAGQLALATALILSIAPRPLPAHPVSEVAAA